MLELETTNIVIFIFLHFSLNGKSNDRQDPAIEIVRDLFNGKTPLYIHGKIEGERYVAVGMEAAKGSPLRHKCQDW